MAKMSSKQRNKLDDSEFGLPEKRMYPLNDKAHVESAVKLFGHCPDEDKPELARRILAKAKEFGMDSSGWTQVNTWAAKGKDYKKNNKKGDIKKESYIYTPERWTYNPTVYSEFYQEAADGEQSGFSKFLEGVKKMWIKFCESMINLWSKIVDFFHGIKVKKILKKLDEQETTNGFIGFKYEKSSKDKQDTYNFIFDAMMLDKTDVEHTKIGMLITLTKHIDDCLKRDDIYDCISSFSSSEFHELVNNLKKTFAKTDRVELPKEIRVKKDKLVSLVKYVSEHSDLSAIRRMRYRVRKLKNAAEDKGYVGKDVKKFSKDLRADGAMIIKCMQNYQSSMAFAYKTMMTTHTTIDTETVKEVNVTYRWFRNFCNKSRADGCEFVVLFDNHINQTQEFYGREGIDYVLAITKKDGSTEAIGLKNTGPKDPELTKLIGPSGMVKIDVKKTGLSKTLSENESTELKEILRLIHLRYLSIGTHISGPLDYGKDEIHKKAKQLSFELMELETKYSDLTGYSPGSFDLKHDTSPVDASISELRKLEKSFKELEEKAEKLETEFDNAGEKMRSEADKAKNEREKDIPKKLSDEEAAKAQRLTLDDINSIGYFLNRINDSYTTFEDVMSKLSQFAEKHPDMLTKVDEFRSRYSKLNARYKGIMKVYIPNGRTYMIPTTVPDKENLIKKLKDISEEITELLKEIKNIDLNAYSESKKKQND